MYIYFYSHSLYIQEEIMKKIVKKINRAVDV